MDKISMWSYVDKEMSYAEFEGYVNGDIEGREREGWRLHEVKTVPFKGGFWAVLHFRKVSA
jgi:hypothetical protein